MELTQEVLKEFLHYTPATGLFVWLERNMQAWNTKYAGKVAGYVNTDRGGKQYRRIRLFGKDFAAHRLAWLYVYGSFPTNHIDHINQDSLYNSITNLRDVSNATNTKNQKLCKRNTSGHTGVVWTARLEKWTAQIGVDGKVLHLGCFSLLSDAVIARKAAENKYGFHGNHGLQP